jgi:hypothetical protein
MNPGKESAQAKKTKNFSASFKNRPDCQRSPVKRHPASLIPAQTMMKADK